MKTEYWAKAPKVPYTQRMLTNGKILAIKKLKKVDEKQQEQFINEVYIMSKIDHWNIIKLLGCCLEMEVPLLVYEFVPNGSLYHHIHYPRDEFHITWEMRLRIAADAAAALAYLHSDCSLPNISWGCQVSQHTVG